MTSLSSKQILNLITATPGRKGYGGKVAAAKSHLRQLGRRGVTGTPQTHDDFIRALEALDKRADKVKVGKYHHPERDPRADSARAQLDAQRHGNGGGRQSYEFTAVDLAWLNRLPSDPAAVSYDDAVQLAGLAAASSAFKDPAGHRLVQSIWKPVKEVHDAKAAAFALKQAQQDKVHDEPEGAVDALADALAQEKQLSPSDARSLAREWINSVLDELEAYRAREIDEAESAVEAAQNAQAERTSLSKA